MNDIKRFWWIEIVINNCLIAWVLEILKISNFIYIEIIYYIYHMWICMFYACRVKYNCIRQAIHALHVFLMLRLCACRMCFIVVTCSVAYAMYHIHSLCDVLYVMRCIMSIRYAMYHVLCVVTSIFVMR